MNCFKQSLELDDKLAYPWTGIGYIYLTRDNNLENAKKCFEKSLGLDEKYVSAWNNLGLVAGRQGDYNEAFRCFNTATSINPDYASAWYNTGVVQSLMKNSDLAIDAYIKTIKLRKRTDFGLARSWNRIL